MFIQLFMCSVEALYRSDRNYAEVVLRLPSINERVWGIMSLKDIWAVHG